MKFRIVASLLVLAALAAAATIFGDDTPAAHTQPAPAQGADDKALKSLSIN